MKDKAGRYYVKVRGTDMKELCIAKEGDGDGEPTNADVISAVKKYFSKKGKVRTHVIKRG